MMLVQISAVLVLLASSIDSQGAVLKAVLRKDFIPGSCTTGYLRVSSFRTFHSVSRPVLHVWSLRSQLNLAEAIKYYTNVTVSNQDIYLYSI